MAKPGVKADKLTEKQQAYHLLRANGLSVKQAEAALGYKERSGYAIEKKVKNCDPSSLVDPKIVSSAHKAIKKLVKGRAFGDIKEVKDSTALRAAEMVMDRAQPKVNMNQNLNISLDISPVDLSAYRTGSSTPEGE